MISRGTNRQRGSGKSMRIVTKGLKKYLENNTRKAFNRFSLTLSL
jgi:hypothetical protein